MTRIKALLREGYTIMPDVAWVGVTITIIIAVCSHIVASVWWAARITTILEVLQKNAGDVASEMKAMRMTLATKEDLSREVAILSKEQEAIWKNIDKLKERV